MDSKNSRTFATLSETNGCLAQLVQSICLTSRGSAVRIRQHPQQESLFQATLFLFPPYRQLYVKNRKRETRGRRDGAPILPQERRQQRALRQLPSAARLCRVAAGALPVRRAQNVVPPMHSALLQAVDAPTDARGDALFRSAHDFLRTAGNNTSHFQIKTAPTMAKREYIEKNRVKPKLRCIC